MPCHHSKFALYHTGLHPKDSAALEEVMGSRVGNIHLYKHMHAEKRIIVAQTHTHMLRNARALTQIAYCYHCELTDGMKEISPYGH